MSKKGDGQDENFRERLELNADAKDKIQISPIDETSCEEKKFCFAQNPSVKCIPKAKFCFYLLLVTFFYFSKMQGKFIYMRISAKFKSIFTRAQRLRPFAEI